MATAALHAAVITMEGPRYALFTPKAGGEPQFPEGPFREGETPAEAARRLVKTWTGTEAPKLELVDFLTAPGQLTLVFRALLTAPAAVGEAAGAVTHRNRMELPDAVGSLKGKWVEDALKTGLNYKLTRV